MMGLDYVSKNEPSCGGAHVTQWFPLWFPRCLPGPRDRRIPSASCGFPTPHLFDGSVLNDIGAAQQHVSLSEIRTAWSNQKGY